MPVMLDHILRIKELEDQKQESGEPPVFSQVQFFLFGQTILTGSKVC